LWAKGTPVQTSADWQRRREEILSTWHRIMGPWPPLIERPCVEVVNSTRRENITQQQLRIEIALGKEMVDALHSDYVRAARLKGLSERRVVYGHALRNALLPTITIAALDVGYVLGGIIVVEEIFAIPGIGRQIIVAVNGRDLAMIQAGALILAATYALMNFLADMAYAFVDKRIQYG